MKPTGTPSPRPCTPQAAALRCLKPFKLRWLSSSSASDGGGGMVERLARLADDATLRSELALFPLAPGAEGGVPEDHRPGEPGVCLLGGRGVGRGWFEVEGMCVPCIVSSQRWWPYPMLPSCRMQVHTELLIAHRAALRWPWWAQVCAATAGSAPRQSLMRGRRPQSQPQAQPHAASRHGCIHSPCPSLHLSYPRPFASVKC